MGVLVRKAAAGGRLAMLRRQALAGLLLTALPFAAAAFDLQGHRGARGLAPENSLPGIARALSIGVTTLELDVGLSADGALVVLHDRRPNPDIAKDAEGRYATETESPVRVQTLAELRRYDVGEIRPGSKYARSFPDQRPVPDTRIPTLGEVVALTRQAGNDSVRFNIETKLSPLAPDESADPDSMARALVAAIRAEGIAGRATVQSFDWRTLRIVQDLAPEIPTAYLSAERPGFDTVERGRPGASPWTAGLDVDAHGGSVPRMVTAAGGRIWSPAFRDLTAATLKEAKDLGLTVIVWTVNARDDMERTIGMGVDGIITDRPDLLRSVMAEKGMALPAATPVSP